MVRPGMKRLREAQSVKVQPNKTGTSFMLGQSVIARKGTSCVVGGTCQQNGLLLKKGVKFSEGSSTPYNDLSNNRIWESNPVDIETALSNDRCCNNIKQKSWPTNADGSIIAKSWNFSMK
tara:strand:- start:391 stop:750 length:360 start_codon:yes stop_codon:yes gene_type:complete